MNGWCRGLFGWALLGGVALGLAACCGEEPAKTSQPVTSDEPVVWVVDDGERVGSKDGVLPAMGGRGNPIWEPSQPIRLIGLPGETVAFQVVVTGGALPLRRVTVELSHLSGPVRIANAPDSGPRDFRPIERFVVHELPMSRRSGGKNPRESLGWSEEARPAAPASPGLLPDPLIPVELAPPWADYPMSVKPHNHRVVWVDITLPESGLPAGTLSGTVAIKGEPSLHVDIPLKLRVGPKPLPYAAVRTMVFSHPPAEIVDRIGDDAAVDHFLQLMHRHHLSVLLPIKEPEQLRVYRHALTGQLYTPEHGYHGPGQGVGADVVGFGPFGTLREPTPERIRSVEQMLMTLRDYGIEDDPGQTDVFLYAVDEQCDSPYGPQWRYALDASGSGLLRGLRVGHTCSTPPAKQPVDLVMMFASAYDTRLVEEARAVGKRVWIYNGMLPQTGTFLTDGYPLSLRANAWIQARYGIERWFYWEATFWNDGNKGGLGPYDPLARAETFHNQHGDHCNGDGVLVYPGRQTNPMWRSLGLSGVVPSIRLKQWRRGISDMGYVKLARRIDPSRVDAILRRVVPRALTGVGGSEPAWTGQGKAFFEAREALFEIVIDGS